MLRTARSALGVVAGAASAQVLFGFEEHPFTSFGEPTGVLTSLVSERDGLVLTIVRSSGAGFDVRVAGVGAFAAGWGLKMLDPFAAQETDDFFVGTFSEGVAHVALEAADFLEDQDFLSLEAFAGPDASGDLVDEDVELWGSLATAPDFVTVTAQADVRPIRSIRFRGGSDDFPNSMFVDSIAVAPLPEPGGGAAAAGTGLALAALARRHRGRGDRSG